MTERVTLVGVDEVVSASHTISRAAERMIMAANTIDAAVLRLERALESFLQAMTEALAEKEDAKKAADNAKREG